MFLPRMLGMSKSILFWKIYLAYSSLFIITLGLTVLISAVQIQRYMRQEKKAVLEEKLALFIPYFEEYLRSGSDHNLKRVVKSLDSHTNSQVSFIDRNGLIIADSKPIRNLENQLEKPELIAALNESFGYAQRFSEANQKEMIYVSKALRKNSRIVGFIRVAIPSDILAEQLYEVKYLIVTVAFLGILFHLLMGLVISRKMTIPITEMMDACDAIRRGHYDQTVKTLPNDEIGRLGDTLNQLGIEITKKIATISLERAQFKSMIASMVEGVVSVDNANKILFCNKAAYRFLNSSINDCRQQNLNQVEGFSLLQEAVDKVCLSSKAVEGEITRLADDEHKQILEYNAAPFAAAGSSGVIVVLHDITRVRQLERIRRDFVANVSHEIKTPLTSIKGYTETLLQGAMTDHKNNYRFLVKIKKNAERLVSLVQDIISLAQIESQDETIHLLSQPWKPVIEQVLAQQDAEIQKKMLKISIEDNQHINVMGDKDSMVLILDNLVSNAIRYSHPEGLLSIAVKKRKNFGVIIVKDTGIGIPRKDIERIFERFYRVDKDRSRQLGGTGLGLSIVKHLVQRMSGEIKVTSEVGVGSSFEVYLPQA